MANPAENTLSEVLAAYAFAGEVVGAARFGQGHISTTRSAYTPRRQKATACATSSSA